MSTDTPATGSSSQPAALPPPPSTSWRHVRTAALGVALLAGASVGAGGMWAKQRVSAQPVLMLQPAGVSTLRDDTMAAIKGRVRDVFGSSFIVDDGSGRALVDTGPRGEGRAVVAPDETVTVQGRFDRGRLHAQLLVHADGRSEGFGPPKPPKPDRGPPPPPDRGPPAPGDAPPPPREP